MPVILDAKSPLFLTNYSLRVRRVDFPMASESLGAPIRCPKDVARAAQGLIGDATQEHFLAFYLNPQHRILGYTEVGVGGADYCPVDPRTVFRTALIVGSTAVIVAHNHPSGDPTPSAEDKNLTERLKEGAKLLGLELLDHVVVTDTATVSFREEGIL